MGMQNYRLKISYDGTRYYGWEHQPDKPTIQGKIEMVLARMCNLSDGSENGFFGADAPLSVIGAGRTDAGVHARAMVANVQLENERFVPQVRLFDDDETLTAAQKTARRAELMRDYLNRYLPDDIAVLSVKPCAERFHARYNAVGKTYEYTIFDGAVKPVFNRRYYTPLFEDEPLDVEAMQRAAEFLKGEHDFKSFCGNPKFKKSTVRTLDKLDIRRSKGYVYLTFHGNGFLQNMVRILTGTLVEVGYHRLAPEAMPEILEAKKRSAAGPTALAKGLCLVKVDY